jgi:hypothetical protein
MWFAVLLMVLYLLNRYVLDALFAHCAGPPPTLLCARMPVRAWRQGASFRNLVQGFVPVCAHQ